jgi:hypothetical protein
MRVEIPGEPGSKVISIDVLRKSREERRRDHECEHNRVIVDTALGTIECALCNVDINPIEWIASMAEEWDRVMSLTDKHRAAIEEVIRLKGGGGSSLHDTPPSHPQS